MAQLSFSSRIYREPYSYVMISRLSVSTVSSGAISLFVYRFLSLILHHASTVGAQTSPEANTRMPFAQIGSRLYVQGGSKSGPFFSVDLVDLAASWPFDTVRWAVHNYGEFTSDHAHHGIGINQTLYMKGRTVIQDSFRANVADSNAKWSLVPTPEPRLCRTLQDYAIDPRNGIIYSFAFLSNNTMCLLGDFEKGWETRLVSNGSLTVVPEFIGAAYNSNRNSVIGGYRLEEDTSTAYVTEYRIDSNSWSTIPVKGQVPATREANCMIINEDNTKIVVFGGFTPATRGPSGFVVPSSEIFVLDLNSGEWKKGPDAAEPRASAACGLAGDRFVAWGGEKDSTSDPYDSIVVFDLAKFEWLKASSDDHPSSTPSSGPSSSGIPTTKASNTNIGAIAGGAVAGLVLVALIVAVLIYRRRKQRLGEGHGPIKQKIVEHKDNSGELSEDEAYYKNELTYQNPQFISSPRSPQEYPYLGRDPQEAPGFTHGHDQDNMDRI
ncbi:hypothetical protein BCR41DRAFT_382975 [Lobosporangium transversale]|uniref:Kelch repeat protein n=1 Tax=Lobosporangium transversale TaxID=64571 RepID=A0A1Y2H537_9FUNG|nr:hypothetical protein BCR41DRAFT_382975 [Lobosporangium transversale]ORZ29124.1 hypothetical protein BCR41DRAFT_382975 [Lobosporangium transversale]|eukprot:XP_021886797.1 hypothetical protein BCR41DRAFT_382975 [Lobosporangium transversale]